MTADLTSQVTAGLLLVLLASVLSGAAILSLLVGRCARRNRLRQRPEPKKQIDFSVPFSFHAPLVENPARWIAIRSTHVSAVQAALGLHNPEPCTWGEGFSKLGEHNLFISPPVQGWILIFGQGLPDPVDDVDVCYHFLTRLSRAFGQVQFFYANRAVNHHAWARVERGQIVRAYAWADETLWNQGALTQAEKDLEMKCFAYFEEPEFLPLNQGSGDTHHANAEKVFFLGARWSLDPTSINENMVAQGLGVAGDLIHNRQA